MKLSVIIPTCDRISLLERAITSVQCQFIDSDISGFTDIDIVIVNDGVNVTNKDIVNICENFNNFKVKVIKNTGLHSAASARNLGVRHCNGDYVTFLDDDDQYLNGRLNSMIKFHLKNIGVYSFISSGRIGDVNDLSEIVSFKKQRFGIVLEKDIKYKNDIDIGFLIEKKLFLIKGGFPTDMKAYEDWSLILRLLEDKPGYKICRLDYLVNIDNERERVSDNEFDCCETLARKHGDRYGDKWINYIINFGLYKSGRMYFISTLRSFFLFYDFFILKWYFFGCLKKMRNIFS
ncbi:glycosyltransferase [Vibrio sp. S11_S32]|uniref:glycosyltransferase family 2 protein n=1 Tax=Vibrio sp. S11_S32 TaxID=2720225 RepID=UPI001680A764|nr:glycosyltransferase family 2 protein [Vibrio sp. S11_S32]MBD1577916.1 glycosyltransferase [Vibrio sp. S11_S32]